MFSFSVNHYINVNILICFHISNYFIFTQLLMIINNNFVLIWVNWLSFSFLNENIADKLFLVKLNVFISMGKQVQEKAIQLKHLISNVDGCQSSSLLHGISSFQLAYLFSTSSFFPSCVSRFNFICNWWPSNSIYMRPRLESFPRSNFQTRLF